MNKQQYAAWRTEQAATRDRVLAEMVRCRQMCPLATNSDLMVMCANHLNWNARDESSRKWLRFAVTRTAGQGR